MRITVIVLVLFAALSLNATATSTKPADPTAVPAALVNAGEYGENIYDYAKANNWVRTTVKLNSLKAVLKQLPDPEQLQPTIATLEKAVSAKDRRTAMREANQITLLVANRTTAYKLKVPVEVTKLDYYGRELEIWAEAKDMKKLQDTVDEMSKTWEAVRPLVEAHKGTVAAKTFDSLIAKLKSLKSPVEFEHVAKLLLDEVDVLERVFERP